MNDVNSNASEHNPYFKWMIFFLAGLTVVRYLNLWFGVLELAGDEAHYWEWSRRLDWCYYSKPPGVAALIWLGTQIFGPTELGVRFTAPILSVLASVFMYLLGKKLYTAKVGALSAILLQVFPLYSMYGTGITPDTPLLFLWIASLFFFYSAWQTGNRKHWIGLTCSIGLALLSKYAIVFFLIPMFLFLAFTENGRKRLKTIWPYLSVPLAGLFFIPVLYWNSQNNWVMFRHDIGHTNYDEGFIFTPMEFLSFIVGQFGVVTPIMAGIMLYLWIKHRKEQPFCFWFSIPILIGFTIKSLQGKIQPNWPMTAWIVGIPPVAYWLITHFSSQKAFTRQFVSAGIIIPAVATFFLHVPILAISAPWPEDLNPLKKITGWRETARIADEQAETMQEPFFIASDYYMVASELAFYMKDRPVVYCPHFSGRMNQYHIWPGIDQRIGENALFITKNDVGQRLEEAFEKVEKEVVTIKNSRGHVLKYFIVFRCTNLQKWERKKPNEF